MFPPFSTANSNRTTMLILCIFYSLCVSALGVSYSWDGGGTGDTNWNAPANWNVDRTSPDPSDLLEYVL